MSKEPSIPKTNAMRMLDGAKIPYQVLTYAVDENDLSGMHIAVQLNFPPEQMFKTLVAKGDHQMRYRSMLSLLPHAFEALPCG